MRSLEGFIFEDNIKFFKYNLQTVTAWNIVRKLEKLTQLAKFKHSNTTKRKKFYKKLLIRTNKHCFVPIFVL